MPRDANITVKVAFPREFHVMLISKDRKGSLLGTSGVWCTRGRRKVDEWELVIIGQ